MYMKTCTKCHLTKPFDAFYVKIKNPRTGHTQYVSVCRECKLTSYVSKAKPKPPPVTEKTCKVCAKTKPLDDFYVNSLTCRACISDKNRAKRVPATTKPKQYSNNRQAVNKRRYRKENKLFYLRSHIGTSIVNALSHKGHAKRKSTVEIIGCTIDQLREHLEKQFLPGMSWLNRHLWHIDHIVPQKLAATEEQIYQLNHYTNLRPLWSTDNQQKAARITEDVKNHPIYTKLYTP